MDATATRAFDTGQSWKNLTLSTLANTRLPQGSVGKTLIQRLQPLKSVRVWRFGLYYFFVLILVCLVWMHMTVRRMMKRKAPDILRQVEDETFGTPGWQG